MNLRHAAALASVGWYLLMPPYIGWKEAGGRGDPPLSLWAQEGVFDSAAECKRALEHSFQFDPRVSPLTGKPYDHPLSREELGQIFGQLCIASDDPRLGK